MIYLNNNGAFIDSLHNDTALQFDHSILLLKIVHTSRGASGVLVHVLSTRLPT